MNGMGGEVTDGSGTIDPANLSNSGTYNCAVLASASFVVSPRFACLCCRDRSIARTPAIDQFAIIIVGCLVPSSLAHILSLFPRLPPN
jgi:hypothetical protein